MSKAHHHDTAVRKAIQRNIAVEDFAPYSHWGSTGESEHFVQFYETDEFLLNSLSGFISTGLSVGEAGIVVATQSHRAGLEQLLHERGLHLDAALESGQLVVLDAAATLDLFMIGEVPDAGRFADVIGGIVDQAARNWRRVRIFGEMVALLWAKENYAGAIRLEELWNNLHERQSFVLACAYPLIGFDGAALVKPLSDVCARHSRVIPAESYTALTNPADRLRAITALQQKARLLQAEIVERKQAEVSLRAVKDELEIQVEDLRRLHEMSVKLTSTLEIELVLPEVLRAALAVQGSDLGMLSLWDAADQALKLKVSSGFDPATLNELERVSPGLGVCGTAYGQRQRVIVEDLDLDPITAPFRELARQAGLRACHSTPLITHTDTIIGVLSVHFRQPHRPSEREIRLMDLYARMAADFIENARLHHQMQHDLEVREQLLVREHAARAEAETANRLKDEFLANVSHELRTPLTTILGWSQRLKKNQHNPATVGQGLEIIERSAKSQAHLIEDILDVSRVIAGKLQLKLGPIDLATVINAAVDSVQLVAQAKAIQLEVSLDPLMRQIIGDAMRLQQIFWNLLSNAIKFTPAGGRVRVLLEHDAADARITVSDTGEGISADFLPFIFDRFRQADGTSTRSHGGLGLGLAIVQHLVRLHGGTIQADSPGQGGGAWFTIRLPVAGPA